VKKFFSANDHVLPRPVESLPEYAHAKSRNSLVERLVAAFNMSEAAAETIAEAVVDPSAVRKSIGEPTEPQVEEIAVPGGKLLGIRTAVWSRRIMPDPRNPRTGPARRHAFAVDPGMGDEDSRFRPLPEPQTPDGSPTNAPELVVAIESRHHLEWASSQASEYVLAENDWRDSIKSQGVMEAVWLVPTTYIHGDGAVPVTGLTTVEGSSRTTAVHNILAIRSSDVPYDKADAKLRTLYRKLNESLEKGIAEPSQIIALRCERIPALILVGFRRDATSSAGFPTAVKSLVALRHVDPPKPWGDGPANESLADEVLGELYRRKLITESERAYYAGSITKAEAMAAHLSDDPIIRASRIVELFASADDVVGEAIRIAVTSQSTRKRISMKMCNELLTSLIVRSVTYDAKKLRRHMSSAFSKAVYKQPWKTTGRSTDNLLQDALKEVQHALADASISEPGPSTLELAVRSAYPLIVSGALVEEQGGNTGSQQPDRRNPAEVLDGMRRTPFGVRQLAQAIRDFSAERQLRAVDETGAFVVRSDGNGEQIIHDVYLRNQFPPPGKVKATTAGTTPAELLKAHLADLSEALDQLDSVFSKVSEVKGNDSNSLVETLGVDPSFCENRREALRRIGDELSFWERTYRKRHGSAAATVIEKVADESEIDDEFEDADDSETVGTSDDD